MPDPRLGRSGQGGFSPRLGARDPRLRANQHGAVSDTDLDKKSLARDGSGRTRISAADGMKPLASTATLAELIVAHNLLIQRLRGQ